MKFDIKKPTIPPIITGINIDLINSNVKDIDPSLLKSVVISLLLM